MQIIEGEKYSIIKELFIEQFINQDSSYYLEHIKEKKRYSDGMFQTGYFWDCFKEHNRKTEKYCVDVLSGKDDFYVLWDVLSSEHIFIPNYYKYPQEACLKLSFQEFSKIANTLPEDIYFFDDDFDWCIAMTHEDDGKRRYCLSIGC